MLPAQYVQSGLTRAQIIAILKAHVRQTVIIGLAILAATVIIAKLWPKSYTAQATILVNYEANDATRQAPPEFFVSYMLTQVELLRSRAVLSAVADKLDLSRDREYAAGFSNRGPGTLHEWVVKALGKTITVEQGKGIQLLYVSASATDRAKAALVANTVVEVYEQQERERISNPGGGRANEYSEQLGDLKAKVSAAEQRVSDFRLRNGIADISTPTQQADTEAQVLAALEQQLLQAQNLRREAEARGSADQTVSNNVMGSALVQNLKTQLATLQAELAQMSSTLGPQHPKVLELQSQIAAARRSLNQEIQTFSSNSSTELGSARQLEQKLQRTLDEERAKVMKLRNLQDEGSRLQLELESAHTVYKRALEGYDQIMFASSSIVSRATPPIESDKPNKVVIVILGAMAAIVFGFGGPLFHELFFHRRLRCRDDMERDFGIPVLAEFDPIVMLPSTT
jgi:succinoglycan biosynthesis transport protein ExoP